MVDKKEEVNEAKDAKAPATVKGDTNEVKALVENIGTSIKAFQDKNDENLKKQDGINDDAMKRIEKSITDAMDNAQRIKQLEAAANHVAKATSGSDEQKERDLVHKKAFEHWMRTDDPKELHAIAAQAMESKSLSVNIEADGGFTIPREVAAMITGQIFESSPMRSVANVMTITTDALEFPLDDNTGISGGWVAEKAARTETATPELGMLRIPTHEQFAQPAATQKILDDSGIDIEGWLSRKTVDIISRTENTAFITGNGSGKPRGILDYPAWAVDGTYERDALEQISSGSAGAVTADGLKDLLSALKAEYRIRAVWMMQRNTFGDVLKLKDAENRYLLGDGSLNNTDQLGLLGKQVVLADDMAVIATDSLSIALGDFNRGYTIVDRLGITVLRDPFTNKPFILFYTTKRVGAEVTNFEAIKIQPLSA